MNRALSKKYLTQGMTQFYEKENTPKAIQLFKKAILTYPKNEKAHLQLAEAYEDQNKYHDANKVYHQILGFNPKSYLAHQYLAQLYVDQGQYKAAMQALKKAFALKPDAYSSFMTLAELYQKQNKKAKAIAEYQHLIKKYPKDAEAYIELACLFENDKKFTKANALFEKGIALNRKDADSYLLYGLSLMTQKKWAEAIKVFDKLLVLEPKESDYFILQGSCYVALDDKKNALKLFKRASKLGNTQADYQLKLLSGKALHHIPKGDVKSIFNDYAKSFEHDLIHVLRYRVPEILFSQLQHHYPQTTFKKTLDLGCGTGLLGEAIQHKVANIDGVDISSSMLKKAEKKQIYRKLYQNDIVTFLKGARQKYDLVISSDVMIYLGDLAPLFQVLPRVLEKNAVLAFSTEDIGAGSSFVLQASGRYAHSLSYIQNLAKTHGFHIVSKKMVNVRKEYHQWIKGRIYVLEKRN